MRQEYKDQNEWLQNNFNLYPNINDLLNIFEKQFHINITKNALKARLFRLNLRRASTQEKNQWLIKNYNKYDNLSDLKNAYCKECHCRMENISSLSRLCTKLNLYKKENIINWKNHPEYDDFIKTNYDSFKTYYDIKDALKEKFNIDIPWDLVKNRCHTLNLPRRYKRMEKTEKQKQWIMENYNKYSGIDATKIFNQKFHTNYKIENFIGYCNKTLHVYFSDNKELFKENVSKRYLKKYPIGSERMTKEGQIEIKIGNDNWMNKARYINGLQKKDNYKIIIINKDKPITKENTIVVDRSTCSIFVRKGYNHIPNQMKRLAANSCKLQTLLNKEDQ